MDVSLPLRSAVQMNGFSRDHTRDRPTFGMDQQALTEQNLHVPAADRIDSDKSEVVNVTHDQSNLVTVCVEQNRRSAVRVHGGHDVSMHVGCDLSREHGCERTHHFLNTLFDTGCAWGLKQVFKKLIGHLRRLS